MLQKSAGRRNRAQAGTMTDKPPIPPTSKRDDRKPLHEKTDEELDADAKAHQREVWRRRVKKRWPVASYTDEQIDELIKRYQDSGGHEGLL